MSIQTHTHCSCALQYWGPPSHHPAQQDISVSKASNATVMTSRHPLFPQPVQFSSTLPAAQSMMPPWPDNIHTTAVSIQFTNRQKAIDNLLTHGPDSTKDLFAPLLAFLHFLGS